ncbi:MAG: MarR family winged helix-turn-helix transcriptional regulator [Syntrophobacteraceae bacterium]
MNVGECIFFLLAKCSQAGSRFWGQRVASLGVTGVQAMILTFLSEEDMVTSKQLGERTILDSATLTGILDRLEATGLIERRSNPEDRRAIMICLTEGGRAIGDTLKGAVVEANQQFLTGLSREEELMFRGLLKRLLNRAS